MPEITIKLKLFAAFKEAIATSEISLQVPSGCSVAQMFEIFLQIYPNLSQDLSKWRSHLRYAVNLEFVDASQVLADGDEVAFIPPVSGG